MESVLILMGVSGTGKTTIGQGLSDKLNWPYFEGDKFHPPSNVEKMRAGIPLNDEDRAPWLLAIRAAIEKRLSSGESAIFTCSALKASYREVLQRGDKRIKFIYLQGSYDLIMNRLNSRTHEYMPASLLKSQFETL
ncbi:MAG: gluconokinase [Bacteroidota bacterium]